MAGSGQSIRTLGKREIIGIAAVALVAASAIGVATLDYHATSGERHQDFWICNSRTDLQPNSALIWFDKEPIIYEYDRGFNGQWKFRPSYDISHPVFMVLTSFNPDNPVCQQVTGRLIG